MARDQRVKQQLIGQYWRVMVVWECELVKHTVETIERVARWLRYGAKAVDQFRYEELAVDRSKLLAVAEKRVRYRISSYAKKQ